MKISELITLLEKSVPLSLQESWDNSGIQIMGDDAVLSKVLLTMEITNAVIDEAIDLGVDMIITHHPLIFGKINSVRFDQFPGKYIVRLMNAGISVYSSHTCFDKASGGNNDFLSTLLRLTDVSPLKYIDGNDEIITRCGNLPHTMTPKELYSYICDCLELQSCNIVVPSNISTVTRIGLCTGAGSEFAEMAISNDCEAFITGDVKYHEAQNALEQGICLVDAGHFGTEKFFPQALKIILENNLADNNVELIISKVNLNPFS